MTGQTALITGASSGIGAELTKLFAADGSDLVLVARREQRLEELATEMEADHDVSATVVAKDLTEPDATRELFEFTQANDIGVDALVNNAGFGIFGRMDEVDIDRATTMIDLNVTALTQLTYHFLGPMVDRDEGAILNVASMAGMVAIPNEAVYAASKAYVRSFSEALASEFADTGITVTALCPGPVDTEFIEADEMADASLEEDAVSPRTVAEAGYNGLQSGKRIVIPTWKMRLFNQSMRVLPRRTAVSLAGDSIVD